MYDLCLHLRLYFTIPSCLFITNLNTQITKNVISLICFDSVSYYSIQNFIKVKRIFILNVHETKLPNFFLEHLKYWISRRNTVWKTRSKFGTRFSQRYKGGAGLLKHFVYDTVINNSTLSTFGVKNKC